MEFAGGYPSELFLTPPKDVFNCSICLYTAKEPMRCEDEHIFCKKCILTWIAKGKHSCPIDRKTLSTKNLSIFRFADEMLGDYCVQCVTSLPKDELATRKRKRTKKEKAKLKLAKDKKARKAPKSEEICAGKCEWTGKLNSLQNHMSCCPETTTTCTWKDCDLTFLRKNLAAHVAVCRHRLEPCEKCGTLRKPSKRNIHKRRCPATPALCPNRGCTMMVQRADVPAHRLACAFETVPCPHSWRLGCTFTALRKDITAHSEDKLLHFDAAVRQVDQYRETMNSVSDKVSALSRLVASLRSKIARLESDAGW